MKSEYFILCPLLCIAAKESQESCLNICGQLYDRSRPCQCNTACTKYGNCCNDYDKSCPKEFCVGSCGQPYNKTHQCHCNKACKTYQHCCDDYDVFCLLRVNESSTTEYTKSETTFITSEFYEESTSRPTTSLRKDTGMIVGIVISISVIVLTILVILAFMYRRTYAKEQLSLNTAGRKDRSKSDMDNNPVISDYQQLDNVDDVQKMTQAYDQLHVPCNQTTNGQVNTSFSRQEYSEYECIVESNGIDTNTVISEYEELHKADKDTSTQQYNQLNVTRVFKTEPTNFFFKTKVSSEKPSKNESTKATTVTIEYEQLNYAKKDKSVNVYDQLHVTDIIDTDPTNYNSKTTISRDQHSKNEPTEETTELNNMTVTSEYEQLDNAKTDKNVNVYDQLHGTAVMNNDPTHLNPCQGFKENNISVINA